MTLKVVFGTILLNESRFLPLSLKQHYDMCDEWFLIEGADVRYPSQRVTADGLSTDGSADIIRSFPDPDKKLKFIQYGWAKDKRILRNQYAELADEANAGILIVVDVDEFLTQESMRLLRDKLASMHSAGTVRIPHVHFWHNTDTIVTGGYWDVPHDRAYRWQRGNRYVRDHNHPEKYGVLLRDQNCVLMKNARVELPDGSMTSGEPLWLHYANCKQPDDVRDKNTYYLMRGEGKTRPVTVESREAFFEEELPAGLRTFKWAGPRPEVFQ